MLAQRHVSVAILVLGALAFACSSDDENNNGAGPPGSSSGTTPGGSSGNGGGDGDGGGGDGKGDGGGGGGADDDGIIPGDSIWRKTSEWYRAIDTAPIAEHSSEMTGALAKWGLTGDFQIDFSFNVLDGQGATPVTFPPDEEGDSVAVPIPAKGYIEGDNAYNACPDDEDCHILVLDRPAKKLYEVYQAHKNGAAWDGYVAFWQLDKTYPRTNRGQGCTSADAAGLAITPGLIGYRETKKGTIGHALRFIIRNEYIRGVAGDKNTPNVVYPGSHGSTAGDAAKGIPYGGRLRLKTSITENDPRIKTPGAKAIVRALHTYGMILADGGNIPLTAESVRVHADADPAQTWEGLLGAKDLSFIQPGDFEVVAVPKEGPTGAPGWYQTKAEYEGQLKKPLGCQGIVQP